MYYAHYTVLAYIIMKFTFYILLVARSRCVSWATILRRIKKRLVMYSKDIIFVYHYIVMYKMCTPAIRVVVIIFCVCVSQGGGALWAVVFEWIIINNYSLYHCLRGDTAIEIRIVNVQSIYYIMLFSSIYSQSTIFICVTKEKWTSAYNKWWFSNPDLPGDSEIIFECLICLSQNPHVGKIGLLRYNVRTPCRKPETAPPRRKHFTRAYINVQLF